MYFRFGSAIVLVVLISAAGIALEKRALEFRRKVSRQHYRMDVLRESYARLRLKTQQLGAPTQVIDALEEGELPLRPPERPSPPAAIPAQPPAKTGTPLLRWRSPTAM